jgi:hypothetical protein
MSKTFFFFAADDEDRKARVPVPGKTFKPCLMFAVKASAFLILG